MMNENELLMCVICFIVGYLFAGMMANGNGFNSEVVMSTALSDMNNAGCCVSNTAGYSFGSGSVSPSAPGFSIVNAYSNPCAPL